MAKKKLPEGMTNVLTSSQVEYTAEEEAFIRAMDAYKHTYQRMFPTCREVLLVRKSLGYRQVAESTLEALLKRQGSREQQGSRTGPEAGPGQL